jgi:anti-sigma factor RsiW
MFANDTHRLADGSIDYDHYHRRARRLRRASRRHSARRWLRVIGPFAGAAALAASFILVPAATFDCCAACAFKRINRVIASHQ